MPVSEEIQRKKEKLSDESLILWDYEKVAAEERDSLISNMIDGQVVKKSNIKIVKTQNKNGKIVYFLLKDKINSDSYNPNRVAMLFGNILFRIVSNKEFTIRRCLLTPNGELATKWDPAINETIEKAKEIGLKPETETLINLLCQKDLDPNFIKSAACLLGAEFVLGETDSGTLNHYRKEREGKQIAVAIDRTPLINMHYGVDYPAFGSVYSSYFIKEILAQDPYKDELLAKAEIVKNKIDELIEEFLNKGMNKNNLFRQTNNLMVEFACEAILDPKTGVIKEELWQKIQRNIEKNPQIKEYFMCFMDSINNTIELSQDEKFLDNFIEKFQNLPSEKHLNADQRTYFITSFQKVLKALNIFKENAIKTEKIFAPCLEYYKREILAQELVQNVISTAVSEAVSKITGLAPKPESTTQLYSSQQNSRSV